MSPVQVPAATAPWPTWSVRAAGVVLGAATGAVLVNLAIWLALGAVWLAGLIAG